jgi:hypothetical protein
MSLKPTTTLLLGVGALWLVLLVGAWQPRLLLPLASALTLLAYVAAWCHWAWCG